MAWTTPTLVEICIGLEINGYLPAEFWNSRPTALSGWIINVISVVVPAAAFVKAWRHFCGHPARRWRSATCASRRRRQSGQAGDQTKTPTEAGA